MIIIIEGPDASGKSTLVHKLAQYMNWPVEHSPGPTKTAEEFNDRLRKFLALHNTICDRHPAVSEEIYGIVLRKSVMTDPALLDQYRTASKFVVYCAASYPHVVKAHDTEEHLQGVARNRHAIKLLYDQWALQEADYIYRGGQIMPLLRACGAFL